MVRSFLALKFSPKSERRLLSLCLNNPDNDSDIEAWNKNAVQYLVRKLRKEPQLLDELEKAISQKYSGTKCIPLPKTAGKRLLISHRRGLPQVIYCRLWRWPDLQSHHQIRPIHTCESSPESTLGVEQPTKSQKVCINPYHYERLKPKPIEPILISTSKIPPDLSTSLEDSDTTGGTRAIGTSIYSSTHQQQNVSQTRRLGATTSTGDTVRSLLNSASLDPPLAATNSGTFTVPPTVSRSQTIKSELGTQIESGSEAQNQHQQSASCFGNKMETEGDPMNSEQQQQQQQQQEQQQQYQQPQSSYQQFSPQDHSLQQNFPQSQQDYHQPQQYFQQQYHSPGQQFPHQTIQGSCPPTSTHQLQTISPHQSQAIQHSQHLTTTPPAQQQQQPIQHSPFANPSSPLQHQQQIQYVTTTTPPHQQQPSAITSSPQQQPPLQYNDPHHSPQQSQQQAPQYQHDQQGPPPPYTLQPTLDQQYPQTQEPYSGQYVPLEPSYGYIPGPASQHQGYMQQPAQLVPPQPRSSHPLPPGTEIARPYRFKQNRFANLVRAKVAGYEHGAVRYQRQESHVVGPYPYNPPPTGHQNHPYQPYWSPPRGPYQPTPGLGAPGPTTQQSPQPHYPQPPPSGGPTYTTMYSTPQQQPQQSQFQSEDQQMQLDYQPDQTSLPGAPQQQLVKMYDPVPGPSRYIVTDDQSMAGNSSSPVIDIQEVPYDEGSYWCSISYHEYDHRIGEKYNSSCRSLYVDGYTKPMCNNRFCIGGISNVNRNQFTEWVRRRIGRGVRLTYVDGEVFVECLSESSVFVSSPLQSEEDDHGQPAEKVSRLTHGCSTKVFSTQIFSKLLSDSVGKGFEAVYKLTNLCVVRISFVKGWGKNYKRQSIFNTPCWVEVQLNGPLQWIDKVLRQMRPPTGCGSTS